MSMTEETQQFIDHYLESIAQGKLSSMVFFGFLGVLLLIFIIRFFILFGIEKKKTKRKYDLKHATIYIMSHTSTEFVIAVIICFVLIKLTGGNPNNFMINFVLAPIVGTLVGVYADNKIFIPIETATGFGSKLMKSGKKDEKKDGNNITININNQDANKGQATTSGSDTPADILNSVPNVLEDDLADSDDFNTEIIHAINDIKKENASQNKVINANNKKLDKSIEALKVLQEAEMINKKLELKSLIYACLNQGYATPEQNDKITLLYSSYEALGGNHEIKTLYYQHYLKLPVHSENTFYAYPSDIIAQENLEAATQTIYDKNNNTGNLALQNLNTPTRLRKRIYNYGEFDNEE